MNQEMSDKYQCGICSRCGNPLYAFTIYGQEIRVECKCVTEERERQEAARKNRQSEERTERRIARSGLPPKLQRMSFDNFEPRKGAESAFRKCKEFAETFGASDRGILLVGQQGSGKTHLACAALMEVMRRGYSGKFIRAADLPYLIRETYDNADKTESEVIEPLRACSLLVIDDIGVIRMTEFDRGVFQSLIDYRINYGRPTIYTTNLLEEEMEQTLNSQTIDRIFSPDNTEIVLCNAESYRRRT